MEYLHLHILLILQFLCYKRRNNIFLGLIHRTSPKYLTILSCSILTSLLVSSLVPSSLNWWIFTELFIISNGSFLIILSLGNHVVLALEELVSIVICDYTVNDAIVSLESLGIDRDSVLIQVLLVMFISKLIILFFVIEQKFINLIL